MRHERRCAAGCGPAAAALVAQIGALESEGPGNPAGRLGQVQLDNGAGIAAGLRSAAAAAEETVEKIAEHAREAPPLPKSGTSPACKPA